VSSGCTQYYRRFEPVRLPVIEKARAEHRAQQLL
jgi:hypothetical protein